MSIKVGIFAAGLALAALAVPVSAHHSWTAEYDSKKPVTVKGVVSKVEWTNPHTHFYVDVTDGSGKVTTWNFEMASTPALERGGWSRKTLPVGTQVVVEGFAGRSVAERAIVTSFKGATARSSSFPSLATEKRGRREKDRCCCDRRHRAHRAIPLAAKRAGATQKARR